MLSVSKSGIGLNFDVAGDREGVKAIRVTSGFRIPTSPESHVCAGISGVSCFFHLGEGDCEKCQRTDEHWIPYLCDPGHGNQKEHVDVFE